MWIYGYGSLMWDGWEIAYSGTRYEAARLAGFRRSFNKKSVRNWGTPQHPGPTLGLEEDPDSFCVGTAFEIADRHRTAVIDSLKEREGASFVLRELEVALADGRVVKALIAMNARDAPTYIGAMSLKERALMARTAVGKDGRCID